MKRIVMFVEGRLIGLGFNERNYDIRKCMEYFVENVQEAKVLMILLARVSY